MRPMDQPSLFDTDAPRPAPAPGPAPPRGQRVLPAEPSAEVQALAHTLARRFGGRLHLGTSSWHFPGWAGLVWAGEHPEAALSKQGLVAYAQHPLLRTVSLDRAFYRPLDGATYRRLAAQTPEGFRFVVKAPAAVTDAVLRDPASGAPLEPNPLFLDPQAALDLCARPAAEGLGERLGVLVFQISPLPRAWLAPDALLPALERLWPVVLPALPAGTRVAIELRDAAPLTPALAASLKAHGVRCCIGLHDRMPPIEEQLPMQRATWPGDLVCRWNLHRGLRYKQAKARWEPFDRLQAPDADTRQTLARVILATLNHGHQAFVVINNKAEGSAPLSVLELARLLASEPETGPASG
jgi:uncharacterized protein YecE (DUF72 family)